MNPILDVAIGVVLVFLVMAVLVSSVTEIFSGLTHVRASTLERGIAVMLGNAGKEWLYNQSSVIKTSEPPARGKSDQPTQQKVRRPSYIDSVAFATALVDGISTPTSETMLEALLPADQNTRKARVTAAFHGLPQEQQDAVGEATDTTDDLARYLLTQLFLPSSEVTPAIVGTILGSVDDVEAIKDSLGDEKSQVRAALDSILDPRPADTAAVVAQIKEYSIDLSTPRLSALVDGLAGELPLSSDAIATIGALARRADGDVEKFRLQIENWFDREMDRVSGTYSRWSQIVMVIVGLALAIGFNVSAYTVGRALWVDPTLRATVVTAAEQTVATTTTTTTTTPTTPPSAANAAATATTTTTTQPSYQDLESYGLPVGWNKAAEPNDIHDWILHILGWMVVAIAASFGAPFWFDTLNKFVNLRTSGPPPATSPVQPLQT